MTMTPERNRPAAPGNDQGRDTDVLLLSTISNEMVQAQKNSFGRGPTQAKSYLLDDFLLVVMRHGATTAEGTAIELGRQDLAREFRLGIQEVLADRLIPRLQELTGRRIVNHRSQVLFAPHIVVEIFFFEQPGAEGGAATEA